MTELQKFRERVRDALTYDVYVAVIRDVINSGEDGPVRDEADRLAESVLLIVGTLEEE